MRNSDYLKICFTAASLSLKESICTSRSESLNASWQSELSHGNSFWKEISEACH